MLTFLVFKNAKSHFIPESLLDAIRQDLIDREHPVDDQHTQTGVSYYFDFGGMAAMGMPTVKRSLSGGVELEIPADQVDLALCYLNEYLREKPRQTKDGQPFYKVHGAWHCYVFTPEALQEARQVVIDMMPEAESALTAFENERRLRGLPGSRAEVLESLAVKGFVARSPEGEA